MNLVRTISEKGQVVVPKDIRDQLGLKPGSEILFEIEDGRVIIKKKMTGEEFVKDFCNVPKKVKGLNAEKIDRILEEEYDLP